MPPRLATGIALFALLAFPACANGVSTSAEYELQSPIDLTGCATVGGPALEFAYGGAEPSVEVANGFIAARYEPGNALTLGGREYMLREVHAHAASEHRIDGELFAAELHMVHQDEDGGLLVVGVLYDLGEPDPIIQGLLDAGAGGSVAALDSGLLNPRVSAPDSSTGSGSTGSGGAPNSRCSCCASAYYRYRGSRTTPPFDGPVEWIVLWEQGTVSHEQVEALMAVNGGEPNNREIQPRGEREITLVAP